MSWATHLESVQFSSLKVGDIVLFFDGSGRIFRSGKHGSIVAPIRAAFPDREDRRTVRGSHCLQFVTALRPDQVQISNAEDS